MSSEARRSWQFFNSVQNLRFLDQRLADYLSSNHSAAPLLRLVKEPASWRLSCVRKSCKKLAGWSGRCTEPAETSTACECASWERDQTEVGLGLPCHVTLGAVKEHLRLSAHGTKKYRSGEQGLARSMRTCALADPVRERRKYFCYEHQKILCNLGCRRRCACWRSAWWP